MKKILILFLFLFALKSYSTSQIKFDSINIQIKNQILILNQKNDSLTKRLDQIEKNDYRSIEVIEKINDFYDKSWNKLIAFLSIAGSIILIVLPYIQNRNYEEKIDNKTAEFQNLIDGKVAELEMKIKDFHHEQFELLRNEIILSQAELNKNIKDETQNVHAYVFALRGMIAKNDNKYDDYFRHFILGLKIFIGLNKTSQIKQMIEAINTNVVNCIDEKIKIKADTNTQLKKLILVLEKDFNEVFPEIIERLKLNISKLTF